MEFIGKAKDTFYEINITFKPNPETGIARDPIAGKMAVREYRRMKREFHRGRELGTYEIEIQIDGDDWRKTEITFPVQEIDTIVAVPEVTMP